MDKKLLRKLLKKTDLVTYVFVNTGHLRNANYLNDAEEREQEFRWITGENCTVDYDFDQGFYLYHKSRNTFKLIALIKNDEIKVVK